MPLGDHWVDRAHFLRTGFMFPMGLGLGSCRKVIPCPKKCACALELWWNPQLSAQKGCTSWVEKCQGASHVHRDRRMSSRILSLAAHCLGLSASSQSLLVVSPYSLVRGLWILVPMSATAMKPSGAKPAKLARVDSSTDGAHAEP